jgi:hypothetical protein
MRRAAAWKSSLPGAWRALSRQAGRAAPCGRRALEVQRVAVAAGAGDGLLQGPDGCGLLRRRRALRRHVHAAQPHVERHGQRARQQPAEVRHVGHAAPAHEVLHQLERHPHRQHDQRGPARVVEVEEHHVEEADAPHAVHHRVHAHQRRHRARGPQTVAAHAGVERQREERRPHAPQQVEAQVGPGPQRHLQREAEEEQEHHVADQVPRAAVQEGGRERLHGLPPRAAFVAHGPALGERRGLLRREGLARSLPARIGLVARADDLPGQQALAERAFVPHEAVQLGMGTLAVQALRGLGECPVAPVAPGPGLQVLDERRQLQPGQRRGGVARRGALHGRLFSFLPAPVDEALHGDEQHRHPRRRAPGGLVLERYGDEHLLCEKRLWRPSIKRWQLR